MALTFPAGAMAVEGKDPAPAPVSQAAALAAALRDRDVEGGAPALLQVLAAVAGEVNGGQSVGSAIRIVLTRNGISAAMQEASRQTLLANWHYATEFGLLTPENLERMRGAKAPLVTLGGFRGQETVVIPTPSEYRGMEWGLRLAPASMQVVTPRPIMRPFLPSSIGPTPVPPIPVTPDPTRNLSASRKGHFTPAPKATVQPGPDHIPDFVEIAKDDCLKLVKYGCGTEEIFIHSANEKEGIHFAMVDPSKMKYMLDFNGYDKFPNTTYHTVPWKFEDIPGTKEKGVPLTKYMTAFVYFVRTVGLEGERYRMCVLAPPRGEIATGPPIRKAQNFDLKKGEPLNLKLFGGGDVQLTVNGAMPSQGVWYTLEETNKPPVAQGGPSRPAFPPDYPASTRYPGAQQSANGRVAPWKMVAIPGEARPGVPIAAVQHVVVYYLEAPDVDESHVRVCVVSEQTPAWNE